MLTLLIDKQKINFKEKIWTDVTYAFNLNQGHCKPHLKNCQYCVLKIYRNISTAKEKKSTKNVSINMGNPDFHTKNIWHKANKI